MFFTGYHPLTINAAQTVADLSAALPGWEWAANSVGAVRGKTTAVPGNLTVWIAFEVNRRIEVRRNGRSVALFHLKTTKGIAARLRSMVAEWQAEAE